MNAARGQRASVPLGLLAAGESAEVGLSFGNMVDGKSTGLLRLEEMGLRPGARLEVLANEGHGPLLLKVGESRIAVGRGIAMKLQVRPVAGSCGRARS